MTLEQGLWMLGAAAAVAGPLLVTMQAMARVRDKEQASLVNSVAALQHRGEKCQENLQALKDELHTHYVRNDALAVMRQEMRQDFDSLFNRLNGISRDLERMTGRVARHLTDDTE